MNYEILINRYNRIPRSLYDNIDLVEVGKDKDGTPIFLEKETYKNFSKLKAFVYEQRKVVIEIEDGYRSPEKSKEIYQERVLEKGEEYAHKYVAFPNYSEHNIGIAVDYEIYIDGVPVSMEEEYEKVKADVEYINSILHMFGFILRYPKDKEDVTEFGFEPWHIRYVGTKLAEYLYRNNFTLEERYNNEDLLLTNPILNYDTCLENIERVVSKSQNNKEIFKIKKAESLGNTNFEYPINHYTAGVGDKHIIAASCIHGCEIITVSFILELMNKIAESDSRFEKLLNECTIHFIPLYNPEGFIISSSAIEHILKDKTDIERLNIITEYFNNYRQDDINVANNINGERLHRHTFNTCTLDCIGEEHTLLKRSVGKILSERNLSSNVLGIWSSNGCGVDLNKNHPFEFEKRKYEREQNPYLKDRYGDIDRSKPGPLGYIGDKIDSKDSIENQLFLNFISKFKDKMFGIYLYHSTGGTIYSELEPKVFRKSEDILLNKLVTNTYSFYSYYNIDNDVNMKTINGYIRELYNSVPTFLVELSKVGGNPLGPFINMLNYKNTVHSNLNAFLKAAEISLNIK